MAFQNRYIPLQEFLGQVRARVEQDGGDLVLFDTAMQGQLEQEFRRMLVAPDEWNGAVNAGDFDKIYPLAAGMLRQMASELYSEAHPTIYNDANAISEAFATELNDVFHANEGDTFDLIPIQSWADMMADAGLVTIENGMVLPTPLGTEVAQDFARGVERE